jgi:hypothetical protein
MPAWPPLPSDVATLLRITTQNAQDAAVLDNALAAAVADVQTWRADLFEPVGEPPVPPPDPPASVWDGTVRYAAAIYTARQNTTAVDPLTPFGAPVDVALSPTIARLLGIGRYAKPRVG